MKTTIQSLPHCASKWFTWLQVLAQQLPCTWNHVSTGCNNNSPNFFIWFYKFSYTKDCNSHQMRSEVVDQSAQSEPRLPGLAEIFDVNVVVPSGVVLAPPQQLIKTTHWIWTSKTYKQNCVTHSGSTIITVPSSSVKHHIVFINVFRFDWFKGELLTSAVLIKLVGWTYLDACEPDFPSASGLIDGFSHHTGAAPGWCKWWKRKLTDKNDINNAKIQMITNCCNTSNVFAY